MGKNVRDLFDIVQEWGKKETPLEFENKIG